MAELNKNVLLNIPNSIMNAGVMKILRYNSIALKRFGGKYKYKANFYNDQLKIDYNQWQDDLTKYKAPKKGDKGLDYGDLGRGNTVSQFIPLTEIGCASELISKQQMKQAMGSPERLAEFVADKIEVAASRAAYEIDKKFLEDICNVDNYKKSEEDLNEASAIFLNSEDEYKLGTDEQGATNIRKLIKSIKTNAAVMKRPTDKFNKFGLISTALEFKRIGVIISEELFGALEDHYENTFNLEYAKLERMFAWVETMPLHEMTSEDKVKSVEAVLITDDGYVCEVDEEADTGWDDGRRMFQESWWYQWIYTYQAMALGKNAAIFAAERKEEEEEDES